MSRGGSGIGRWTCNEPPHTARYGYSLGRPIQPPKGWRTLPEGSPIPPVIRVYERGLGWGDESADPYRPPLPAKLTGDVLSIAVKDP
jgi:hypothetical protein